jgi:hypothetical protein
MLPGPNRSGVTRKSFIEPPSSVHVGDKYLDPEKVDQQYFKEFHTRAGFHELEFKPSSGPKTLYPAIKAEPSLPTTTRRKSLWRS